MDEIKRVTVTDIKMPFSSMVLFMIKWAIASIPAAIILFVLFLVGSTIFGILTGLSHGVWWWGVMR